MRIALVNDLKIALAALSRIVTSIPGAEVAWMAEDGEQATPSEEIPAAEAVEAPKDEVSEGKTTSIFGAFAPGASKEPAAVVKEDLSQVPMVDEGDDDEVEDDEVEDDTEAFLEKVFSELDDSSDEEEGEEEGYGLLRRRRMGAFKDSSGDA